MPSDALSTLSEYLTIAGLILNEPRESVAAAARLDLADSALHAPQAAFGDVVFYPDVVDQAAVLLYRLARNHPLPDGNKRAAWVFAFDETHANEAQSMIEAVAAGSCSERELAVWLRGVIPG